jgi:hypothetical protein
VVRCHFSPPPHALLELKNTIVLVGESFIIFHALEEECSN